MLYTRKQMMEEVYRKVDEERRERMFYDTLEEFRARLFNFEKRIEALENKPPETFVVEHHGRK